MLGLLKIGLLKVPLLISELFFKIESLNFLYGVEKIESFKIRFLFGKIKP
jgi:hypothetical protein